MSATQVFSNQKFTSLIGCYSTVAQARNINIGKLPTRDEPGSLLMCDPYQFRVIDVKNAFMEGHINDINAEKSRKQWESLKHVFENLGHHVDVVMSRPNREDMVFTANQVLLGKSAGGNKFVVLANMIHSSRQKEVPYFEKWFLAHGYRIIKLRKKHTKHIYFEGQGDALWHPGRQLLWGGYGHRSDVKAYHQMCGLLDVPILILNLVHSKFYHLDTAFCPLDEKTVMFYPKAFDIHGNELIRHFFKNIIPVNDKEAENFACNALALGKHVVIQKGSGKVCKQLKGFGFIPVEVETSEFMKSGGSVSCLKMLTYENK